MFCKLVNKDVNKMNIQEKINQIGNIKRKINEFNIQVQELELDVYHEQENAMGDAKSMSFKCDNGLTYSVKRNIRNVFNKDKWEEVKGTIDKSLYPIKESFDTTKAKKLNIDGLVEEVMGKITVEIKL